MTISPLLINVIGWTGAALVLIAYALLSIQWIRANSFSYQFLNVTGAIMLVINSYYMGAYPSVGVNVAWVGIGALTLLRNWWKDPVEAYKKVRTHFTKRVNLQKITLKHIKLLNFKHKNHNTRKASPQTNGLGHTQLS
jgi:hypothetical protein